MAWKRSSALALLLASVSCAAELQQFEAAEPHMGTLFRITLYAPDADSAQRAFRAAFDRIAALDDILSDYKPDSELMRLCRSGGNAPVHVSRDLFSVLDAAQRLSSNTRGAFDVTLGPLIRLGRDARRERVLPSPGAIASAAARSGYDKLSLDAQAQTAYLDTPGMLLDLGGIAKGYAADQALELLRLRGIGRALVAASGDLAIGDPPPRKPGWRVGVDSFRAPADGFARVVTLSNAAVSTSGDTEQFAEIGGVRYSHIVDPASKRPLTTRIGVTVIARRGIDADSYATALSVLGVERGLAFIDSASGTAALFSTDAGITESRRFAALSNERAPGRADISIGSAVPEQPARSIAH
jgi:FAD:protein FMN transferase